MPGQITLNTRPDGGVVLWLDRPRQGNALSQAMIQGLGAQLEQLAQAPPRYLVLAGQGKHFCAGADLEEMRDSGQLSAEQNQHRAKELATVFSQLDNLPCPTLARIQGAAYGGAMGLISACDIAIASESAQFKLSEVRLGLIPAVISPYVMRAIGPRAMRRYALTAELIDAATACTLGLVHQVAPDHALDTQVDSLVEQLLLGAPGAQAQAKALLAAVSGQAPENAQQLTARLIAESRSGAEAQQGIQAFFARQNAPWIAQQE